jgi:hypothetical protein
MSSHRTLTLFKVISENSEDNEIFINNVKDSQTILGVALGTTI